MDHAIENTGSQKGLTANTLKLIAIAAMTIDHLTWLFLPGYRTDITAMALHMIGRLTAPIMMYFVAEGYYHTRNVRKYITRMFVFAIISHFGYALMFNKSVIPFQNSVFDQTSVIWAFAWGLAALAVAKSENPRLKQWHKNALVCGCALAAFCADWSSPASLAILYMGICRGDFKKQMMWLVFFMAIYSTIYAICMNPVYGAIQMFTILAMPLLYMYNGKKGTLKGMKWFFYIYYPTHLAILGLIRICFATA